MDSPGMYCMCSTSNYNDNSESRVLYSKVVRSRWNLRFHEPLNNFPKNQIQITLFWGQCFTPFVCLHVQACNLIFLLFVSDRHERSAFSPTKHCLPLGFGNTSLKGSSHKTTWFLHNRIKGFFYRHHKNCFCLWRCLSVMCVSWQLTIGME